MPAVGFMPPTTAIVATVEAIQRELVPRAWCSATADAGRCRDGIASDEGVFLPCSFWLADALAPQGRLTEARSCSSGCSTWKRRRLLSEEYDPVAGRQLATCAQAFTRLSLIDAAMMIGEAARCAAVVHDHDVPAELKPARRGQQAQRSVEPSVPVTSQTRRRGYPCAARGSG